MPAHPRLLLLLTILPIALLAVLLVLRTRHPTPPHVHRRLLVRLPVTYRPKHIGVASNGTDYAFVAQTPDGQRIVHHDTQGPLFASCSAPKFAPTTSKVFYWALDAATREMLFVADGEVVHTGFTHEGPLVFSKDGGRWAVGGGRPQPGQASPEALWATVIVDGRELGQYQDTSLPAFSPDGAHVAYLVRDFDGNITLVVDGTPTQTYEPPEAGRLAVSPLPFAGPKLLQQFRVTYLSDGSLLVLTHDRDGWAVYRNDRRLASYAHNADLAGEMSFGDPIPVATVFLRWPSSAEASPVAAWWERVEGMDERWRAVRNGKPENLVCTHYWDNQPPVLSHDGQHVAYPCSARSATGTRELFMVADDGRYGPYKEIWGLALSDDGQHVAYNAADDSQVRPWSLYVDGKAYPLKYEQVWRPRLDARGTRVAWEAQNGRHGVLCFNGNSVSSFDEVLWGPEFSAPDTVSWVVRRRRSLVRIDVADG